MARHHAANAALPPFGHPELHIAAGFFDEISKIDRTPLEVLELIREQPLDGSLLQAGSRALMFADYGDGMGFRIMSMQKNSLIRFHGGGINGFVSASVRVIDENRTADAIVLSNNGNADPKLKADPFFISNGLLALASGKSADAPGVFFT